MADVQLSTLLDSVYPSDEATGIPLRASIQIVFSCEMDQKSIEDNILVEGPNTDTLSGPDLALWNRSPEYVADREDLFLSTNKGGRVAGSVSFSRVKNSDVSATYSGFDYTGAGDLYRTKAIFTPTNPLIASTPYNVYLMGQDDQGNNGIRKRSVFDTKKVTGTGSGNCTVSGSYTGTTSSDKFYIEVITGGELGTATFKWWRESAPTLTYGPYKCSLTAKSLEDGVTASFESGQTYQASDKWSCVVKDPDEATGLVTFSFTSGTGSIQSIPSTASTSVIGLPTDVVSSGVIDFEVDKTNPENRDSRIPTNKVNPIEITFTKNLDPDSVTQDRVKISAEPVVDDPLVTTPNPGNADDLPKRLSVSGKVLSIVI